MPTWTNVLLRRDHLHFTLLVGNLNPNGLVPAFEKQVHGSIAGAKSLDRKLGNALGQVGTLKQNAAWGILYGRSQARL